MATAETKIIAAQEVLYTALFGGSGWPNYFETSEQRVKGQRRVDDLDLFREGLPPLLNSRYSADAARGVDERLRQFREALSGVILP